MANSWFRLYHEFATDPKVQMMSESDQRRFVMLLCIRCCNGSETLHDQEVAFQLRISNEEWAVTKGVLVAKNMIDETNNPVAWAKRQYESDSSTARVQKHRDKKKQACNVSVTPPDTDTDTDTEKKKTTSSTKLKFDALGYLVELGVNAEVADEWLAIRAGKKLFNTKVGIDAALGDGKQRGFKPNDAVTAMWKKGHPCFYEELKSVPRSKSASKMWSEEPRDWL